MLGALLTLPFGSWWRLKSLCLAARPPFRAPLVLLYNLAQADAGSSIAWNARFAGPPVLPHGPKSIFVSGGARLGRNCVIFQQVTIGSNTLPDSGGVGAPVIGDNCYIAAGAKIIGGVRIGDNVRIGANAVVHKDVPSGSVVVVGEQRVLPRGGADNRFYAFERGRWHYYEDGRARPVEDESVLAAFAAPAGKAAEEPARLRAQRLTPP